MDTVEWGTSERPAASSTPLRGWRRVVAVPVGRGTAIGLAVLSLGALLAAEVLPWTTLTVPFAGVGGTGPGDTPSGGVHYTINRLDSIGTLTYHFGLFALFALIGAALGGGRTPRRSVLGAGYGAAAAHLVIVVGIVASLRDRFVSSSTGLALPARVDTTVDSGAYLAFAAIALALAALVVTGLPAPVRSRLARAAEPADAQFTDAPPDLTVTPVAPLDESFYARPQPHAEYRRD